MIYYGKAAGLWALSAVSLVMSQTEPASWAVSLLGGSMTLLGMGFLIWRLVIDHSREQRIEQSWRALVESITAEAAREAAEVDRLRAEVDRLRAEVDRLR